MAMAAVVMIAAMAAVGSMAKVMGTSRATAMVAERPGMAPTETPNTAAMRITSSVWKMRTSRMTSSSSFMAVTSEAQRADGQRYLEQVTEGQTDYRGGGDADGEGRQHADAALKQQHQHDQQHHGGCAENLAEVDVGQHQQDRQDHGEAGQLQCTAGQPAGEQLAHAADGQQQAAGGHAQGDQRGEEVGAVLHAGHHRELTGQQPHGDTKGDEDDTEQEVFHEGVLLQQNRCRRRPEGRPTVRGAYRFIPILSMMSPMYASFSSRKALKSAVLRHSAPKPSLYMYC